MTLFHVITPLNCYYGNNFSSIGCVLLVMWHTAVQYRLVHTHNVSNTTSLPLCCRILLQTPTVGKLPVSYGTRWIMTSSTLHLDDSNCFLSSCIFLLQFESLSPCPMRTTCPAHPAHFDSITLTIFGKLYYCLCTVPLPPGGYPIAVNKYIKQHKL